jgi:hypothetical protein
MFSTFGIMLSIGSAQASLGSAREDFWSFRLKLKAQPIEPVHKISLEMPVIQYLQLFLKLLLLDTKIKFNHSLQHL